MKTFFKIRLIAAVLVLMYASSKAQAQNLVQTQHVGSFSENWATVGGANSFFSSNFNYDDFDPNLGTLTSVQFCIDLKGTGNWMADYGGDGASKSLDILLWGGQALDVDGGNGWLGAGYQPVIDNVFVTDQVQLNNVSVPFWIMSPDDGPAFNWGGNLGFTLPNINEFIGTGSDSATFKTYAILDYLTNPNVNIALDGHDFKWGAELSLKYFYTVPEPGSALLASIAICPFFFARRRNRR